MKSVEMQISETSMVARTYFLHQWITEGLEMSIPWGFLGSSLLVGQKHFFLKF